MYRNILCFALFLLAYSSVFGQKSRVVSAEYIYVMSKDVSQAEAERIAIERAKLQAIADEFGTVVHQDSRTIVRSNGGNSTTDFLSLGGIEVKGEWIEDVKPPVTELIVQGKGFAIKATVKGRIREIVQAKIDIEAKVLRNGIAASDESDRFMSGNSMHLLFRSPKKGYLAVYLLDEAGDAYCLLPYQKSSGEAFEVKKDKEYILFNSQMADAESRNAVDEYVLTASKSIEINYLYIIFSPNKFNKANDIGGSDLIPRSLTYKQFQEWLTNNRKIDNEMQVISRSIEIRE